jgi:mRNA interferase RelE/StbE
MTEDQDRHVLAITPTARRQLTDHLPEAVAAAAYAFMTGSLLDNPHRVGKQLRPPLDDRHSARRGTYRVIYRIDAKSPTRARATPLAPAPASRRRTGGAPP